MSKTVYIVRDMPKFDFAPAAEYGEIKFIFSDPTLHSGSEASLLVDKVYEVMQDAKDGDYFVMTSPSPLLFALSFAVYDRIMDGKLSLLRFDKFKKQYNLLNLDINDEGHDDVGGPLPQ